MKTIDDLKDEEIVALTLWGEARGEPLAGQVAVANVIRNRVMAQSWWGRSWRGVCLHPWQFSCWNEDDANRAKMIAALQITYYPQLILAQLAMAELFVDNTKGSTHYHAHGVSPGWAEGKTPVVEIGNHLFYNDIE